MKVTLSRKGYPVAFIEVEESHTSEGIRYIGDGYEFDDKGICIHAKDTYIVSAESYSESDIDKMRLIPEIFGLLRLCLKHSFRLKYAKLNVETLRVISMTLKALLATINE